LNVDVCRCAEENIVYCLLVGVAENILEVIVLILVLKKTGVGSSSIVSMTIWVFFEMLLQ
jgi:hypothetical protein